MTETKPAELAQQKLQTWKLQRVEGTSRGATQWQHCDGCAGCGSLTFEAENEIDHCLHIRIGIDAWL